MLKELPELYAFLSTSIADSDPDGDEKAARTFGAVSLPDRIQKAAEQIKKILELEDSLCPVDEFGTEANRWFRDAKEVRVWLRKILLYLEESRTQANSALVVQDSNGTSLSEGDTVQVIKDLKVKGGSSDLKRGTLIKKIHLIDDADNVECRVDGSTLVLKTIFLKKV